jgi:two-component system NtrC family sensor kinase
VEERHGQAVVLTIVRDITDELELRTRLIHSEKMAAIGALVSGVAHELNNPLAGIAALTQAAMFTPDVDDATLKLMETVHREALRAARIVNGLLLFARLRPLERRDTDLNQLVRDTFTATPTLVEQDVNWETELAADLPAVSADPEQVRQVITNLLTNAAHAMRDQAVRHGRVRTWATPTLAGFEVLDSGPGIAPEALPRIFEPFFTTKAVGEGTGLGLSIAHGIIRAHGGEIRGANQPGGGARFWFELPRDPTQLTRANDG